MAEKRKVWRVKDTSGALEQVLFETSAEQVTLADTANNFTSTNVEGALAEVMQVAQTGGVTGVKGDAETAYRKGNVNITKANIGLGNVDNTADANKSVASAVKATQDGDGNVIKNTYATKTELNGKLDKKGGTITGVVTFNKQINLGQGDANCLYLGTDGRVNGPENRTLFGLVSGTATFGHTAYALAFRGSGTRPKFNGNDLALKSDIPTTPDTSNLVPKSAFSLSGTTLTITI